jgi:hypothetical protein
MMNVDFSGSFEELPDNPEPAKGISHDQATAWPAMDPTAYHGLAGEVVARILPDTESDPAALLLQYLVSFGNAVGRRPYYRPSRTTTSPTCSRSWSGRRRSRARERRPGASAPSSTSPIPIGCAIASLAACRPARA